MAAEAAEVFAALGDPVRLGLLADLGLEPQSIAGLTEGRGITRQGVTKHLKVLEAAGLAVSARAGREVLWSGRREGLTAAGEHLARVGARWEGALERLKRHVEG